MHLLLFLGQSRPILSSTDSIIHSQIHGFSKQLPGLVGLTVISYNPKSDPIGDLIKGPFFFKLTVDHLNFKSDDKTLLDLLSIYAQQN